jgi:hypothetical protein
MTAAPEPPAPREAAPDADPSAEPDELPPFLWRPRTKVAP